MSQALRNRKFLTLADLRDHWMARESELSEWLTSGDLSAHVWLPVMSAFKMVEVRDGARLKLTPHLCHWEGYTQISRHYCLRLFRRGYINLREFSCYRTGDRYTLPETAEDIQIHLEDIVILSEELERFEAMYALNKSRRAKRTPAAMNDRQASFSDLVFITDLAFKVIQHGKKEYRFGDMQARILRQLYESAQDGNPWQNGKRLLQSVGSESFNLSNVFKRNTIWRELIVSDGRGSYCLNVEKITLRSDYRP